MNTRYIVFGEDVEYSIVFPTEEKEIMEEEILSRGLSFKETDLDIDIVYVYGDTLKTRPEMPTIINGSTLVNVHPNSTIYINQKSYPCEEGGDVELEFDLPGTYSIRVVRWPYLDKEFTIEN